jgi:hypothetical protein
VDAVFDVEEKVVDEALDVDSRERLGESGGEEPDVQIRHHESGLEGRRKVAVSRKRVRITATL